MMSRKAVLTLVFLISVVVAKDLIRVSAAAQGDGGKPDEKKTSPSPSPAPPLKAGNSSNNSSSSVPKPPKSGLNPNPKNPSSSQVPPASSNSSNLIPPSSNVDVHGKESPTADTSGRSRDGSQEDGECNKLPSDRCSAGKLNACLQGPASGSQELFLLVKNEDVDNMTVNIKASASTINTKVLNLTKHEHRKISILSAGDNFKIVLNAGNEDCVLQFEVPASSVDIFHRLPSYATRMTPIYGAYILFLAMLIVGGTWACCKLRKRGRRVDGGVPYQELEMGLPRSTSAAVADTVDGWDEGWDDDWEEKATARTPEIRHVGNVSANGLTSRAPNREGWDNDWDD